MKHLLLALLVAAPVAFAQDDCSDCDKSNGDKSCCPDEKGDAGACADKLATARKDLSAWKLDYKKLSRIERDTLKAARRDLLAKDARMKALAPTFGAQADMLAALAAIERMGSKEVTQNAKIAAEMSATYRAMARALAGKKSYPAPKLTSTEEIKATLKKVEAEVAAAKKLWAEAQKATPSAEDKDAIAAAQKVLKQGSPRLRAIAINSNLVGKGYGALDCGKDAADGDPRHALMKNSKELQKLAAPYFKGVNLEKPKPLAPAPST